jgi:hypothetical protein
LAQGLIAVFITAEVNAIEATPRNAARLPRSPPKTARPVAIVNEILE